MTTPVYLDYAASAPIRPEARAAAVCALEIGGNPSSVHRAGRLARAAVERARDQTARLVGALSDEVIFTSGGTEANLMAVDGAAALGARRLIVLMTEHDSLMQAAASAGGWTEAWPVSKAGIADLGWLVERLSRWNAADGAPFVALSLANNETGVIQPVCEAAAIVHAAGGTLHVDAVQAAGKIAVDMASLGADSLALSGHKLGAPQGVGALVVSPRARLKRRLSGGGQERGLRHGTENTPGVAGFGAAAAAALRDLDDQPAQAAWRDSAAARLKAAGCHIVGAGAPRLPGVLSVASEGFASDLQVMALDLEGVMVSAGAACSSGKVTRSAVLTAMGLGDLAGCAIRASGGWATTAEDWDRFADVWLAAHARHAARAAQREYA